MGNLITKGDILSKIERIQKKFYLFIYLFMVHLLVFGQVGINTGGTIDEGAVLEVKSSDSGVLLPRLSDHTVVTSPTPGMIIYDIADQCINYYVGDNVSSEWINPCLSSSGLGMCIDSEGNIINATGVVDFETDQGLFTTLVTTDGKLMTSGGYNAHQLPNLFNGGVSWAASDPTEISGPWNTDKVIAADIQYRNDLATRPAAMVAITSSTAYFTNTITTDSFQPITLIGGTSGANLIEIELDVEGVTILNDVGEVFYGTLTPSTLAFNFTATKVDLPEAVTHIATGDNGDIAHGVYAWGGTSGSAYFWGAEKGSNGTGASTNTIFTTSNFATISLSSPINFIAADQNANTFLTDNGMFVDSHYNAINVPELYVPTDASGNAVLTTGETVIYAENGLNDGTVVTNLGKIYNSSSVGINNNWYLQYELGVSNDELNDIDMSSYNGVGQGVYAAIGGKYYFFKIYNNNTDSSTYTGVMHDFSPISINVCPSNN